MFGTVKQRVGRLIVLRKYCDKDNSMSLALDRVGEVYKGEIFSEEAQQMCRERVDWICSNAQGARVLDLGCSQGIVSLLLAQKGYSVVGVDIHPEAISYANNERMKLDDTARSKLEFLNVDLLEMDGSELGIFDTVILGEVIEHFANPQRVIEKACSFLAEGGTFIVTTPLGFFPSEDHKSTFTLSSLISLLPAGVSAESIETQGLYIRLIAKKAILKKIPVEELLNITDRGMLAVQEILHGRLSAQRETSRELRLKLKESELKRKQLVAARTKKEASERESLVNLKNENAELPQAQKELIELRKNNAVLKSELAKQRAQYHSVVGSFRFRVGSTIVNACKSPKGFVTLVPHSLLIFRDLIRKSLSVMRREQSRYLLSSKHKLSEQELRACHQSEGSRGVSRVLDNLEGGDLHEQGSLYVVGFELLHQSELAKAVLYAKRAIELIPDNRELLVRIVELASADCKGNADNVLRTVASIVSEEQNFEYMSSTEALYAKMQIFFNAVIERLLYTKKLQGPYADLVQIAFSRDGSLVAKDFLNRARTVELDIHEEREADSCIKLAKALVTQREYTAAEHLLTGVARVGLGGTKIQFELARFYRNTGRYSEAREAISKALSREPNHPAYQELEELLKADQAVYEDGFWPTLNTSPVKSPSGVKKVLHVLENSLPHKTSGYTVRSHYIVTNQQKLGYEPIVITKPGFPVDTGIEEYNAEDILDGIPYFRSTCTGVANYNRRPLDSFLQEYAESVRDIAITQKPDLIHAASNFKNAIAGLTAARALGIPFVYEMRGLWEDTQVSKGVITEETERYKFFRDLETRCINMADAVVTISDSQKEEICARGIAPEKVFTVHNAVEVENFPIIKRDSELAQQLGLEGCKVLGYISSIVSYEGIDVLLRAFPSVRKNIADAKLLIVGDGEARRSLEDLAHNLGVAEYVIFTGKVQHSDVLRYYSLIDLFVVPRLPFRVCRYVTPLKPYEAMSTGRALLVSDVEALKSMIIEGETGASFTAGDPEALADTATGLLNNDSHREWMAQNAARWVRENRTWSKVVEVYQEAYDYAFHRTNK